MAGTPVAVGPNIQMTNPYEPSFVRPTCSSKAAATPETELASIKRYVHLAELILAGAAEDSDRAEEYKTLHPSTRNLYLP